MRLIARLVVLGGLIALTTQAGCGSDGGDGEDMRRPGTASCTSDTDCEGDRVCDDGACVSQGSGGNGGGDGGNACVETGAVCHAPADCCGTASGQSTCVNYGVSTGTRCGDRCTAGSQCTSGCCAALEEGGGVCAAASYCPKLAAVGDQCTADDQCESGLCTGIACSSPCSASNNLCEGRPGQLTNSSGGYNWCLQSRGGRYLCYPGCYSDSDCYQYGSGVTCNRATDVSGDSRYICS